MNEDRRDGALHLRFPICLRPESRSSNPHPRSPPPRPLPLAASPVRIGKRDRSPKEQENMNPWHDILPFISKCDFFFRSLSWQLLEVFQRRETFKLKKEINASKLPAGSPERWPIQEGGRCWVGCLRQCQVVPGRQAGMRRKQASLASWSSLTSCSPLLLVVLGGLEAGIPEADLVVKSTVILCTVSTFLLSYCWDWWGGGEFRWEPFPSWIRHSSLSDDVRRGRPGNVNPRIQQCAPQLETEARGNRKVVEGCSSARRWMGKPEPRSSHGWGENTRDVTGHLAA